MLKLFIALQMSALTSLASLEDRVTRQRDERGSVTIEQVLWAGAVIVIVGIVVAAIKFFREHARPESEMDDDSLEAEEGGDEDSATQE